MNANGDMATRTYENGHWVRTFDSGPLGMDGGAGGIPAGFVAFAVIIVLLGIGLTVWP